jgi:hypothetical protein
MASLDEVHSRMEDTFPVNGCRLGGVGFKEFELFKGVTDARGTAIDHAIEIATERGESFTTPPGI